MNNPLLAQYPAALHGYDEMFEAGGQARPHWMTLLEHLGAEPPEAMRQRVE